MLLPVVEAPDELLCGHAVGPDVVELGQEAHRLGRALRSHERNHVAVLLLVLEEVLQDPGIDLPAQRNEREIGVKRHMRIENGCGDETVRKGSESGNCPKGLYVLVFEANKIDGEFPLIH